MRIFIFYGESNLLKTLRDERMLDMEVYQIITWLQITSRFLLMKKNYIILLGINYVHM